MPKDEDFSEVPDFHEIEAAANQRWRAEFNQEQLAAYHAVVLQFLEDHGKESDAQKLRKHLDMIRFVRIL